MSISISNNKFKIVRDKVTYDVSELKYLINDILANNIDANNVVKRLDKIRKNLSKIGNFNTLDQQITLKAYSTLVTALENKSNENKKCDKQREQEKVLKVFEEQTEEQESGIEQSLFVNGFGYQSPSYMLNDLYNLKCKERSEKIEDIEKKLEKCGQHYEKTAGNEADSLKKIASVVDKILNTAKNGQGQGLKILIPDQRLSRLPIFLAKFTAGNNSEKFKNEIRQLLYSLYRSKKLTKRNYNNLINII